MPLSRRAFLAASTASALLPALPRALHAAPTSITLWAQPAELSLVGPQYPKTAAWTFDGSAPGPTIRAVRGERLQITVENGLDNPTSVHWHGLRVPNAMDGVPGLTQPAIQPGETFHYEYELTDAGTYWYHAHQRGYEQVARGLHGALIVEEPEAYPVDRDVTWVLDDWRLTREAAIVDDFGHPMHASHGGRIGNTVTINGRLPEELRLAPGERVRLRIVNTATARIFSLDFGTITPTVIALDGQPVTPHTPDGGRVVLGPAMRADLVLDAPRTPGASVTVVDDSRPQQTYRVTAITIVDEPAKAARGPIPRLPDNALPEPDIGKAERHRLVLTGGAMGGMTGAQVRGRWLDPREMMQAGLFWAVNGTAADAVDSAPLLRLNHGGHHLVEIVNETVWPHPLHLHGHHFRVLSRDGRPEPHRPWRDTVLVGPQERVEVALVADNPGKWLLHCHILEHQASGMMGVVEVA